MRTITASKTLPQITTPELLHQGWQVLIDNLGYSQATRFLLHFPKPNGDSVKEIRKFRKQYQTVEQLYQAIVTAKKNNLI